MENNILSWIFSGGSVGIPKRLLGLLDLLHLDFNELGQLVYLLYLEGNVSPKDLKGRQAATSLMERHLIKFKAETGEIDFSPIFEQLNQFLNSKENKSAEGNLSELIKKIEKNLGIFLSLKDKEDLASAKERYNWDIEFLYSLYMAYKEKRNKSYHFLFFAQMVNGAGVKDITQLENYLKTLDYENTKVREILRRLGKYHNPTISQEEMYYKWSKDWKFSHEMIILASDKTINADNPSFGYVDAILNEWYNNNLKSKNEVEAFYKEMAAKKKISKRPSKVKYINTSGYRDFSDLVE